MWEIRRRSSRASAPSCRPVTRPRSPTRSVASSHCPRRSSRRWPPRPDARSWHATRSHRFATATPRSTPKSSRSGPDPMCGLAGYFDPHGPADRHVLGAMAARLAHRGPDGEGVFVDGGFGMAHRRLAVIELGPAGAQPMASHDGRHVIAFNGEIYNHRELRDELPDIEWRGGSDTETLLEAIARWGVPATLGRIAGMFAFALWDRQTGELVLARDRLGEKPLYVGWQGPRLLF